MKQLVILSGKGGTGKTTFASAFIKFINAKKYADCDVDAPNLHLLITHMTNPKKEPYYGLDKANIDINKCTKCNLCIEHCRFDSISINEEGHYIVDPYACEGCAVCEYVCPSEAVTLEKRIEGKVETYYTNKETFATAELGIGYGTSGLLVAEVKKKLINGKDDVKYAIIDGSPGIGCPVIASISGANLILLVAEPSLSGFNDLKRIILTAQKFEVPVIVSINKYDLNKKISKSIRKFCRINKIKFVGQIPYNEEVIQLLNNGLTIIDSKNRIAKTMKNIFYKTIKQLEKIN